MGAWFMLGRTGFLTGAHSRDSQQHLYGTLRLRVIAMAHAPQLQDQFPHPPWRAFTRYLTPAESERLLAEHCHAKDIPVTLQLQVSNPTSTFRAQTRLTCSAGLTGLGLLLP